MSMRQFCLHGCWLGVYRLTSIDTGNKDKIHGCSYHSGGQRNLTHRLVIS